MASISTPNNKKRKIKDEDEEVIILNDVPRSDPTLHDGKAKLTLVAGLDLDDERAAGTLRLILELFDIRREALFDEYDLMELFTQTLSVLTSYNNHQINELVRATDDEDKLLLAGQSIVRVPKKDGHACSINAEVHKWTHALASCTAKIFSCELTPDHDGPNFVDVGFQGVAANAVVAGMAFELAFAVNLKPRANNRIYWNKMAEMLKVEEEQEIRRMHLAASLEALFEERREHQETMAAQTQNPTDEEAREKAKIFGWKSIEEFKTFRLHARAIAAACVEHKFQSKPIGTLKAFSKTW